uniref:Uncharacterized protein n=1 Tax=Glossina morsitans morsitans TaxID=37546 RepID=A0A1B0FKH9_GLOMM
MQSREAELLPQSNNNFLSAMNLTLKYISSSAATTNTAIQIKRTITTATLAASLETLSPLPGKFTWP